ncbi:hypothetical protein [Mycobacterium sp. GA-1841]|uniref:hypothetical protein n=1 Tax=Mycobacterium sp. GA-1841 TaxID=1834154 RepID=UPI00096C9F48|nr:hypothetical protein [Mycobacterium sp. GA-1841]
MTSPVWRGVLTVMSVALLSAGSMAAATIATPAASSACPPGETGVTNGCSPFCVPGRQLDTATGLCLPVPPPAPAPNGVATPSF